MADNVAVTIQSEDGAAPAGGAVAEGSGGGRRERKKADTHRRIFAAADALFAAQGYAGVTTQQIAELADVGAGTLFRYARTKAELLIMVMNERLRLGAERGLVIAERGGAPDDAVAGLVEPLVQAAISHPENTSVFQREVLFGADGPYRTEALQRIRELEEAMVTILARHAPPEVDVRRVAGTIFSVLFLKLVRFELGQVSGDALPEVLRDDVAFLVRELIPAPEPPPGAGGR